MTNPRRARAGWYPDPLQQARLRWWDNHVWTEHISNSDAATIEPNEVVHPPASLARIHTPSASESNSRRRVGGGSATATATATASLVREGPSPWARVATALNPAAESADDAVVTVRGAAFSPLVIDVAEHSYWCATDLRAFPREPGELTTEVTPRVLASIPDIAGNDLDPLLWLIGITSFHHTLPEWLDSDDRHRLRRWPNMPALEHDDDQLRMMSMLSHASLSIAELAAIAEVPEQDARALVGACSLMGVLRTVPGSFLDSEQPSPPARASRGLFRRLRSRLAK